MVGATEALSNDFVVVANGHESWCVGGDAMVVADGLFTFL